MKLRVTGTPEDIESLKKVLSESFNVLRVSDPCEDRDDVRNSRVYIDIMSKDREVASNLRDYQIIDYCNKWRSKADVMHYYGISFEAAGEILDRLADSGALIRRVEGKRYIYADARFAQFVKRICGNCEAHDYLEGCLFDTVFDDLGEESPYIPVAHPACEKFCPTVYEISCVMSKENFDKLKGGS